MSSSNIPFVRQLDHVNYELQDHGRVLIIRDALYNPETDRYHDIKLTRSGWKLFGFDLGGGGQFTGITEDVVRQIQMTYGIVLKTLHSEPNGMVFWGNPKKTSYIQGKNASKTYASGWYWNVKTSYPYGQKKDDVFLSKEDAACYGAEHMTVHDAIYAGIWNQGQFNGAALSPESDRASLGADGAASSKPRSSARRNNLGQKQGERIPRKTTPALKKEARPSSETDPFSKAKSQSRSAKMKRNGRADEFDPSFGDSQNKMKSKGRRDNERQSTDGADPFGDSQNRAKSKGRRRDNEWQSADGADPSGDSQNRAKSKGRRRDNEWQSADGADPSGDSQNRAKSKGRRRDNEWQSADGADPSGDSQNRAKSKRRRRDNEWQSADGADRETEFVSAGSQRKQEQHRFRSAFGRSNGMDKPISSFPSIPVYRANSTPSELGYDDAPFEERKRRIIAHLNKSGPIPFSAFVDNNSEGRINPFYFRRMTDALRRLADNPQADDEAAKYMNKLFKHWFRAAYHYLDKNSKPGDGYEQILSKVSEEIKDAKKAARKAKELYWRRHATDFWMTLVDLFGSEKISIDAYHKVLSTETSLNSWF